MLNHPFLTTLGLSITLSFLKVLFIERSLLSFCAQFLSFPYWAVILIFLFFTYCATCGILALIGCYTQYITSTGKPQIHQV